LARLTGDRARDVDQAIRAKVLSRLEKAGVPTVTTLPLRQVVALSGEETATAFGESLPAGLRM
jgi:hypothetical protein